MKELLLKVRRYKSILVLLSFFMVVCIPCNVMAATHDFTLQAYDWDVTANDWEGAGTEDEILDGGFVEPGQVFKVDLYYTPGDVPVTSMQIGIKYDPAVLEPIYDGEDVYCEYTLLPPAMGGIWPPSGTTTTAKKKTNWTLLANDDADVSMIKVIAKDAKGSSGTAMENDGVLYSVYFKVKDSAAAGTPVDLSVDSTYSYVFGNQPLTAGNLSLMVYGAMSSDVSLKTLTLTGNNNVNYVLSPAFVAGTSTRTFDAIVPYKVSSVTIAAEASDTEAKVLSGGLGSKPLTVGDNSFNVVVQAQNGKQEIYLIRIKRLSNDASLKTLSLTGATLDNPLVAGVFIYSATVPYVTTSTTVSATATHANATITSGTGAWSLTNTGDTINTKKVTVNAEDCASTYASVADNSCTSQDYTLNVTRTAASTDNNLLDLKVDGVTVSGFSPNVLSYTLPNQTSTKSSITISATKSDSKAIITGDVGNKSLVVGDNTFKVKVTAEDKSTKEYEIHVKRLSGNNNLATLSVTSTPQGTLTPNFVANFTGDYTYTYDSTVTFINVSATLEDSKATIVSGVQSYSSSDTGASIVVQAEDGTLKTYTIKFSRNKSSDNNLKSLTIDGYNLNETFSQGKTLYTATIPGTVSEITVHAVANDSNATVTGTGKKTLNYGSNTVQIRVKAENGAEKDYTITVTREKKTISTLSDLKVDGITVSGFRDDLLSYTLSTVPFTKTSVVVSAIAKDSDATISGTGTINLSTGNNTISVVVTAHDGVSKTTYTINVEREKSNNAYLSSLVLQEKSFTFNKMTNDYEVEVDYEVSSAHIVATPEYKDAKATVSGPSSLAVGNNNYTITVTAEDGTVNTYTLNVKRKASTNTALSNITVTHNGTNYLTTFNASTESYQITVPNEVDNVDIAAVLSDPLTQTVTGTGNFNLVTGNGNSFGVVVTAASGATKTYTIQITRSKNVNNNLKSLEVLGHTLTPGFSPNQTSYNVTVDSSVSNVTIVATPEVSSTTITGDGNHALQTGANTFNVVATSEDNQPKTYVIVVTRRASNDSSLSSLSITESILNETFRKDLFHYTASVANNVDTVTINATATDPKAKSVTGTGSVSLHTGDNTIQVVVTAEDNTTSTYTIVVTRAKNSNAFLSSLSISGGHTLDQSFNKNDENYTVTVPNSTARILISAAPEVNTSTVSGVGYVDLHTGANPISITVTAEDGTTTKTYTLTVTRKLSSNAYLSSLTSTDGLVNPAFEKTKEDYTLTVPYEVENATINAVAEDNTATVTISGQTGLSVGPNDAKITVRAEDGTLKIYNLVITRQPSSNNYLSDLKVIDKNGINYISVFNKTTMTYNVNVANDIETLTITATAEDASTTVKDDGVKVVDVGSNRYVVKAISGNGTEREYIINVERAKNSNTNLQSLEVEHQKIVPDFSPSEYAYSLNVDASVENINIIATAESSTSRVTGDGTHTIHTGLNTFNVEVIAEDNSKSTYVVVINKAASSNNYLASLLLDQPFTPNFDRDTLQYNATVANDISNVTVQAVAEDPNATVTGNGLQNLTVGHNQITVTVTAENNTFRLYTIDVYREPSTNNYLSDLKVDGVTVEGFNREKTLYKLTVENDVTEIDVNGVLESDTATLAGSGKVHLVTGLNTVNLVVTAQDGSTKTYTVEVTRKQSSNNDLALLSSLEGILSPAFTKENTNYSMQVPFEITTLTLTTVAEDANATVGVEGNIDFKVGSDNYVYIPVTAEDGTTKTYQIQVTRLPQANNFLSTLTVTGASGRVYDLNPEFNKNTLNYTIAIDETDTRLTIDGKMETVSSTIKGIGDIDVSAFPYDHQVVVTSAGGVDRIYTIHIERIKSSNAKLKDIEVSDGSLSPAFHEDILSYTVSVGSDISSIELDAILNKGQTVAGDGIHNLDYGDNIFPIAVTAEDGTTRTYTVKVVREKKIDTTLQDIGLTNATLDPVFAPEVTDYIAYIGADVTDVTISPIANDPLSSISISLNDGAYQDIASLTVNDLENDNTVKIKVTQAGQETIYTVAVLTQSDEVITSTIYGHDISDGMIKTVTQGTSAEQLKDQLDNDNAKLKIYLSDGITEYTGDKVGTGMIVKLFIRNRVVDQKIIVVIGDTDGNGDINAIDALKVVNHIIENELLTGCYLVAAETTGDTVINAIDALRIVNHIIGTMSLY